MKKSIIWVLTIVMTCAFLGLLVVQIMYIEKMVKVRHDQFDELAARSLKNVADSLEYRETRAFIIEDLSGDDFFIDVPGSVGGESWQGSQSSQSVSLNIKDVKPNMNAFDRSYNDVQERIKSRYLYQRELFEDVIISMLRETSHRPVSERADSAYVKHRLSSELAANGLKEMSFEFALCDNNNNVVYKSSSFLPGDDDKNVYEQSLFPNDPQGSSYKLRVYFPHLHKYIFSSVEFMIPSLIFTIILLAVFIYTIIVAFKQKRLSEIKNDFIHNMTHEFKTPISSISLAAQMLNDDSVRKSDVMMKQVSMVISDETKRLRFQVEKVLQMSMFDNKKGTLRLEEADANAIIDNVVNTFKLKVEKFGGTLYSQLDAEDSIVNVDEMHFTNVIFNLLDNAVKYRREDVPLELHVATQNVGDDYLEIEIADNGIGMKKEDLKRIFEKFYRVSTGNRHDVKGFGLGLAYVHKMISLFKGEIKAESELNKGSKFIIKLPLLK